MAVYVNNDTCEDSHEVKAELISHRTKSLSYLLPYFPSIFYNRSQRALSMKNMHVTKQFLIKMNSQANTKIIFVK